MRPDGQNGFRIVWMGDRGLNRVLFDFHFWPRTGRKNLRKSVFSDPDRVESGPGIFFETLQDFSGPGEIADQADGVDLQLDHHQSPPPDDPESYELDEPESYELDEPESNEPDEPES